MLISLELKKINQNKKWEIVLNMTKLISISFLTQNFNFRKLKTFPLMPLIPFWKNISWKFAAYAILAKTDTTGLDSSILHLAGIKSFWKE